MRDNTDWAWQKQAACKDAPPALFIPEGKRTAALCYQEARTYCERCPVRQPCLEYAMRTPDTIGMWGGLTRRERLALAAKRKALA